MSREEFTTTNLVERGHRFLEAANRRDFDAVISFFAPDAVWEGRASGMTFEGRTAIRGFWEDMTVAYEEFEWRSEEILDLGSGVVFVVVRLTARPLGSAGSALVRRRPLVFVWVEGMIARATAYADSIEEGRAAAERLAEERG